MSKKSKKDTIKDLALELDVFDNMLTSLVELLEEKGVLTQEEWEKKIKTKLCRNIENYRDIHIS